MKNPPAYPITSVDHALRLLRILQDGPVHLADAADTLGVARSTAHRLLAMLVYRDFAEQDDSRQYRAGPRLRTIAATDDPVRELRDVARRYMNELVDEIDETANLMVLVGDEVRFLVTVECRQILRVGDRGGRTLPARHASGGSILLAQLSEAAIHDLYSASMTTEERSALLERLRSIKAVGYAVNDQQTENGVIAVGMLVRGRGDLTAAVSIAMPTARFDHQRLPALVRTLKESISDMEREIGT